MAEGNDPKSASVQPVEGDSDVLFKLQVAAGEWFARNWRHAIPLVGVALLGSLVYGLWTSWRDGRIEDGFAAVARIDHKMPQGGLLPDSSRASDYAIGADKYMEAAAGTSGAPAVVAYLKAAEAYRNAGKPDEARGALEKAVAVKLDGLVGFSAEAALAGARLDAGEVDAAIAAYRDMAGRYQGFYARSSLERLAAAQESAGRAEEAAATRAEISVRFGGAEGPAVSAGAAPADAASPGAAPAATPIEAAPAVPPASSAGTGG